MSDQTPIRDQYGNAPSSLAAAPCSAIRAALRDFDDAREAAQVTTPCKPRSYHADVLIERIRGILYPQNAEVSDRRAHGNDNTTGANGGSLH